MALIVEDGTLVDNADSYITLEDARTYADTRGISLSDDDTTAEVQLRNAFDYLEAKSYVGTQLGPNQWPRAEAYIGLNNEALAEDYIPLKLQYAQVQVAALLESGVDILPNSSKVVIREKVGPIETEYSSSSGTGTPILRTVNNLLASLIDPTGTGGLIVMRA